ncbi:hypothetical protein Pcinc_023866 [Petrolisthes cinctipes]|uniref:Uncharacterized protein n=1 Tax=Petrolisthes cinctipes TaxID=88211 RepID=A0AAE1FBP4_PETCI|nr:hypothetical protein Pcinc_023866 [Petrolisthes cinctipes]
MRRLQPTPLRPPSHRLTCTPHLASRQRNNQTLLHAINHRLHSINSEPTFFFFDIPNNSNRPQPAPSTPAIHPPPLHSPPSKTQSLACNQPPVTPFTSSADTVITIPDVNTTNQSLPNLRSSSPKPPPRLTPTSPLSGLPPSLSSGNSDTNPHITIPTPFTTKRTYTQSGRLSKPPQFFQLS